MAGQSNARVPLEPVDAVSIITLVDNVSDALLTNQGPAVRPDFNDRARPHVPSPLTEGGDTWDALKAEHGFSVLLSVQKDGRTRQVLFDTGVTPNGLVENMARMTLSPKEIEAIVLSHGHFDHTTGLSGLRDTLGRDGMPLVLHPEFWNRRRLAPPNREPFELPSMSKSAIRGAGFEIIEERQPSFLLDNALLITGEVDRTTPYERGLPHQEKWDADAWTPDPMTYDDQAVILHLRDRGLVVLTGCGHAGIVNMARYAQKLTGIERVHAVMGGFHLTGPAFEPIIGEVCAAFAELSPEVIVPAHCTGWRATHMLAATFPDAFIQNSVGTRFELGT